MTSPQGVIGELERIQVEVAKGPAECPEIVWADPPETDSAGGSTPSAPEPTRRIVIDEIYARDLLAALKGKPRREARRTL